MNSLLIVEDEKLIRQGIKSMVLRSGIPISMVMECKNGIEALEIIKNQVIDVVITDIRMPKMDGITLVKEINTCKHIPVIIVISGYDDFSYAVELLRYGVRDYLLKPIERGQLTNILAKLEEEFVHTQEKKNTMLTIGYKQLKNLMVNEEMDTKECELLLNQFSSSFFRGEYVIFCTNYKEVFHSQEEVTFLKEVDGQGVFIVDAVIKDRLLKCELGGYYVGCSKIHSGLNQLPIAYKEAKIARYQAFVMDKHCITYYESNKKEEKYPQQEINQIVQMIGTERCEEAIKLMEHICFQIKKGELSYTLIEHIFSEIKDNIYATYKSAINENDELKEVLKYDCLSQYMTDSKDWIRRLNSRLLTQFDDYGNKQKIQSAIAYIKENYKKDLNMAVVSNHISMNYSLFSFVFKQYTGCNFVNYLKQIRVEEAKRLLSTTNMKIADISKEVGYDNDKHFMKVFKCYCGVSPTEYRKNTLLSTQ